MLILVRGLPGSGKTTFAKKLKGELSFDPELYAADDYFMRDGVYTFDPNRLREAHTQCEAYVLKDLIFELDVIVHNTFTRRWEALSYMEAATQLEQPISIYSLFDGGMTNEQLAANNSHGVNSEIIATMRERWEPYDGEKRLEPWIS